MSTEQTEITFPTIVFRRKVVPNVHPIVEAPYRLAIVGEAPGEDEETHGYPFVGRSGSLLDGILSTNGIDRKACLVANCVQVRPPSNEIKRFNPDGQEFRDGLAQLNEDLNRFNPNVCLLLGNTPLHCARGNGKITAWRGSLFRGCTSGPFNGRKCIPSLHPAGVLRDFSGFPLLQFDIKRAREEAAFPELTLPERELITNLTGSDLCYLMDSWPDGLACSIDIEGYHDSWPCVSICSSPKKSWTIAWGRLSPEWHAAVLRSFARLMQRRSVPKVLQNQLSDNFKLCWGFGIQICGVRDDTMIKGWEIFAELPRALGVQASIYTREPHWKDDSMYESDGEGLYRGCALDTAVTLEISDAQDGLLKGASRVHYDTMIQLENPFLYMELRGMNYNRAAADARLKEIYGTWVDKKGKERKGFNEVGEAIAREAGFDCRGDGGSLSQKKLIKAMYESGKYPPQFQVEKGRKTTKLTTDVEALLSLKRHRPNDAFLAAILQHRFLEKVRVTLKVRTNDDGRVRCSYNLEAETGRVRCSASEAGSGTNLTTIQKELRGNYCADDGHDFCQCDLEGADGWTYGAHAMRLGDPTMIDDYRAGLKPAKLIAMQYLLGDAVNRMSREDLYWWGKKDQFKTISDLAGDWVYDGSKVVQHGSAYKMGIPTMQTNLIRKSFKETGIPIYMQASEAVFLQENCFYRRYPGLRLWHKWGESKLMADARLTSASGHTRIFFGRRYGARPEVEATIREFLAHEPQNNTTWATNLAMLRLWNDEGNRVARYEPERSFVYTCDGSVHWVPKNFAARDRFKPGSLLVEPLHQVHDALCVQWPQFLRDWARRKMKEWFQNELIIAGIPITIPFDGTWGPSWGDMPNAL